MIERIGSFDEFCNRDKSITDFCINGECSRCCSCCTEHLTMTEKEMNRIKEYVRIHNIRPIKRLFLVNNSYDDTCPFADHANNKCLIYPVRPELCKTFSCHDISCYEKFLRSAAKNVFDYKDYHLRLIFK